MRAPWEEETQRWLEITGPPTRSELSVMLDLGRMQEVPPQAQILLERIETRETYVTHEVTARTDRFKHPERSGEWLVTVSVDVSDTYGREAPAVIARIRPATDLASFDRTMARQSRRCCSQPRGQASADSSRQPLSNSRRARTTSPLSNGPGRPNISETASSNRSHNTARPIRALSPRAPNRCGPK